MAGPTHIKAATRALAERLHESARNSYVGSTYTPLQHKSDVLPHSGRAGAPDDLAAVQVSIVAQVKNSIGAAAFHEVVAAAPKPLVPPVVAPSSATPDRSVRYIAATVVRQRFWH
jgi:hypothetical protein